MHGNMARRIQAKLVMVVSSAERLGLGVLGKRRLHVTFNIFTVGMYLCSLV